MNFILHLFSSLFCILYRSLRVDKGVDEADEQLAVAQLEFRQRAVQVRRRQPITEGHPLERFGLGWEPLVKQVAAESTEALAAGDGDALLFGRHGVPPLGGHKKNGRSKKVKKKRKGV